MIVGKAFGVRILVDKFFLLLLLFYGSLGLLPQVITVFVLVFIHELAHVLVAWHYGYRVKEIELLPFGGVARIEDLDLASLDPEVEINIALAGPLQNLLLAGVGFALRYFLVWQEGPASFFIHCNLVLAVFNLLPVLPLDGGRIYRAYLMHRMGFKEATEKVLGYGRGMAILLALVGILGLYFSWANISLTFLSLFIYRVVKEERMTASYVFMRFLTRKKRELRDKGLLAVEALMARENTTLGEVVRRFIPGRYHLVFVPKGDWQLEVLTEAEIINTLLEQGFAITLGELVKQRP
ncbi:MAG: peptidase M50 [Firmicutes bacterium]|nr:peptidase M50 [Bacillota bacterium]